MPDTLEIDSGTLLPQIERHFRVVAGPGAGKTHWLVGHIQHVVAQSKRLSPAARIACISYTNVAVNEIISRLGSAATRVDVSTIHSFLYRYVVRPYLHLLRDENGESLVAFAAVDGHDEHHPSYTILKQWLKDIGQAKILQATFKGQFAVLQDKLRNLVWRRSATDGIWELGPRTTDRMGKMLNTICTSPNLVAYKRLYWREGILDHDDILYFAHRILEEYPFVCQCLSARYRYLFIDEFQDTLPIQTNVVQWLAAAGTVVGVIGDAEQSIYGFLDAQPEHFLAFALPDYLNVTIRHNRRSTRRIISILDHVRSDGLRQDCFRDIDGDSVTVYLGDIERVLEVVRSGLPPGSELCVLTRKNKDAHRIRSALAPGTAEPWEAFQDADQDRARFMEQVIAAGELSRRGQYGLAIRDLVRITGRKGRVRKPLKCDRELGEVHRRGLAVAVLQEILTHYEAVSDGTLLEAYVRCAACITNTYPEVTLTAAKAGKFKTFAENTPYAQLAGSVRLQEEIRHVRTIHQAKGSEADNVAVYLEDMHRVQHITHPAGKSDEEKRITYVALSRARDRLFLCIPSEMKVDIASFTDMGLEVIDLRASFSESSSSTLTATQ